MAFERILTQNKNRFLEYNRFRKKLFSQLAPKDSEVILYQLPWMLSVNSILVPGYAEHIKHNFHVFNIETEKEILKREPSFKKAFHIKTDFTVLRYPPNSLPIEGIYTIGSIGTISQTSHSDCDLWICIDKAHYGDEAYGQLLQKIKLIEEWMNARLKIPVHAFLCNVDDIQRCRFGTVDEESCGSTQKKVLKEEFYRTLILIAGKIPLWWVCYDPEKGKSYQDAVLKFQSSPTIFYDFIDLGNLEFIDKDECFGAALWQFNKSLTHPLKSILKMLLLKEFLDFPDELLCHGFRRYILDRSRNLHFFIDPSIYTMTSILDHYQEADSGTYQFIVKCFYLRYGIKLFSKMSTIKEEASQGLFRKYGLDRKTIYELNQFSKWDYSMQVRFGNEISMFLIDVYKEIAEIARNVTGDVASEDLTLLGRKLFSSLKRKKNKITILNKPIERLNLPTLTIRSVERKWQVYPENKQEEIIIENKDLVYCLAYLVWNGLYFPGQLRMLPNASSVTMQEIMILIKKMRDLFGVYDITAIDIHNFLQPEYTEKLFLIVNFACNPNSEDLKTVSAISLNNWGELFVNRFSSLERLQSYLENISQSPYYKGNYFYVQRNAHHYVKILNKTKCLVSLIPGRSKKSKFPFQRTITEEELLLKKRKCREKAAQCCLKECLISLEL